ncbi:undecaprenyl-diphosphatase [Cohnella pontilimi]|uniref:Undecaprenyl-diphosphatase n=1 Tax=Cohnella pontilimi TaxID=2564100 RepID=A0A4U0FGL3_9BACL|nr:undecaprenyl-diphosphatase [Cohnella pontilimi]TJY44067.1 undecaprenyl-diphosphatase [Cohnella pontilimi]
MNFSLFQTINDWAGRFVWMDDLMIFCANDIVWIMLVVLAGLWMTGKADNQKAVFYACLTAAVSLLIAAFAISPEVNHPRPFVGHSIHQLIPHAPDASFPSDHATFAFSLAFSLLFVKRKTGAIMLALAVLTGFARVYVGVHYPADIAGAMALSFLVGYAVWKLNGRADALPMFFIRIYRKLTAKVTFLPRP